MEKHRIALLSDTHGLLRPQVVDQLKTCEVILHAGDIGKADMIWQLEEIAKTYVVYGNVDGDLISKLPKEITMNLFGFQIYMIHNKKQMRKQLDKMDLVIYGHSHKYEATKIGQTFYLNPGSCGPRRFFLPVTMMVLTICKEKRQLEIERVDCGTVTLHKEEVYQQSETDLYKLIKKIMKEADAGKKIPDIAARNQVDVGFVEQVCRMYVTHPGIDVDGIMDRMERRNL